VPILFNGSGRVLYPTRTVGFIHGKCTGTALLQPDHDAGYRQDRDHHAHDKEEEPKWHSPHVPEMQHGEPAYDGIAAGNVRMFEGEFSAVGS